MKKLLLVMLVPVLVLGVMGCGKVPNGDANPVSLQGYWTTTAADAVDLVISGNQVTLLTNFADNVGNIALRTSYDGSKGPNDSGILADGTTFKIIFTWFDKPYDEIGTITATYNTGTPETFTVTDVVYKNYYQNVMLPAKDASYEKN